ncbi:MAG: hypothetical protein ABFQ95_05895 [Pseudomonadota bacterium]
MNSKIFMSVGLITISGIIGVSAADAACKGGYRPSKRHFRKSYTKTVTPPSRFRASKQSRMDTAGVAALRTRHRQILREIEAREKRLRGQTIISLGKTSLQARLRSLKSRLTSAEQLGRVPGNERACNDIFTVISTELRKIDRSMQTQIARASGRSTYS